MTYYIVNGMGNCTDSNLILPNEHNGKPVKAVAENAFRDYTGIQSLVLNDNLMSIGEYAFAGCTNLKSLTLNSELVSMEYSFDKCTALTEIHIPTFYIMKQEIVRNFPCKYDLYLNDSLVTEISEMNNGWWITMDSYFTNCKSLKRAVIRDSYVNPSKFSNCTSLTDVLITDYVERIGDNAFTDCPALTLYDNAYYLGDENNKYKWLISAKDWQVTDCTMHNDCKFIADKAFLNNNNNLKNITFSDNLKGISYLCFYECSSLTSVSMGAGVEVIGSGAFKNCTKLKDITFSDNITTICNQSFWGCHALTEIELPKKLTEIYEQAFIFCKNLKKVTIKNKPRRIGVQAFAFSALQSIEFAGTISQWNAIEKGNRWNEDTWFDSVVSCSDGTQSLH